MLKEWVGVFQFLYESTISRLGAKPGINLGKEAKSYDVVQQLPSDLRTRGRKRQNDFSS